MEIDASLDKYLCEAAVWMVCKQEEDMEEPPWQDLWNNHWHEEVHSLKEYSEEQEVWSPGLPLLDGLVPEVDKEEVVEEEYWECCHQEEEEWELEEKPDCSNPLLKDTFIGHQEEEVNLIYHTTHIIPLAVHWPPSVVFVGSEGSSRISSSYNITTNPGIFQHQPHDNHYHQQQQQQQQQHFHDSNWHQEQHNVQYHPNTSTSNDYYEILPNSTQFDISYPTQNNLFETSNVYQPPNNEFDQLLSLSEDMAGASHIPYHYHQQRQASVFEPLSAPQSIYSSSSDSSWNQQDSYTSDSLSQDEILQEIHRECAQIEERNSPTSPPPQPPSSSKARMAKTSRRLKREPYALQSSFKSKKDATPRNISVSPQSSVHTMDSPVSEGGEKKKELNRIAATKYREKKRLEKESVVLELKGLEGRNTELRTQCSAMEAEIKYLKGLIKEIETRTRGSR